MVQSSLTGLAVEERILPQDHRGTSVFTRLRRYPSRNRLESAGGEC
jgi:hypothetical protein